MIAALKKLIGYVLRACLVLSLVIVVPVLYLLEPFVRFRFGRMYTQRFGHLAQNHDIFLRTLQRDGHPKRTVFFIAGWDPCNKQLFEMIRRAGPFIENRWAARVVHAWKPMLQKTRFWEPMYIVGDEQKLFNETQPAIAFTAEEIEFGKARLREMGIGEDDWFVCIHSRDSSYLMSHRPELAAHWKKGDHRNTAIDTYLLAANYIADQGGFVLRYGAVVEGSFPANGNPRIIDYATQYRSDFMDIFLAAYCRFFVATSSGPCGIPTMFNRPVIVTNHMPYNHTHYRTSDFIIPRTIVSKDGTRMVPFFEARDHGFHSWDSKHQLVSSIGANMHLYEWGSNTENDIRDGCADMIDSLESRNPSVEAQEIQEIYRREYLRHLKDADLGARITPSFALRYKHLIVPAPVGSAQLETGTAQ